MDFLVDDDGLVPVTDPSTYIDEDRNYKYQAEPGGNASVSTFLFETASPNMSTTESPPGRNEDLAKVEIAVLAMIFLLTLLGNFIVLTGIFFRRKKMSRMYYFILHLSIADLITAFFNVLTQLIWELTVTFQGGNHFCKLIKYLQILGPYSSSYVLVMTAIDRYQAICFPLSNCTWTARRSKLMLAGAWTLSFVLCAPQIYIFSYKESTTPGVWECWATFVGEWGAKAYVTWYAITVFIIPLIILTFAYGWICREIWINFSMKNSIRRHQFSRASRISRDSETENEHSHTAVVVVDPRRNSTNHDRPNKTTFAMPSKNSNKRNNNKEQEKLYIPNLKLASSLWKRGSNSSSSASRKHKTQRSPDTETAHHLDTASSPLNSDSSEASGGGGGGNPRNNLPQQIPLHYKNTLLVATNAPNKHQSKKLLRRHYSDSDENGSSDEYEQETALDSTTCPSPHIRISTSTPPHTLVPNGQSHALSKTDEEPESPDHVIVQSPPRSKTPTKVILQGKRKTRFFWFTAATNNNKHDQEQRDLEDEDEVCRPQVTNETDEEDTRELKGGDVNQLLLIPAKGATPNYTTRNEHNNASFKQKTFSHGWIKPGSHKAPNNNKAASTSGPSVRVQSSNGISRAKIKTIKLTVTVICCYVFCSSPFIAAQLWATYDPMAMYSPFWTGATFTILTLLASLNSCVNPWIFLFFNPNLLQDFLKGFGCSHMVPTKSGTDNHSPNSATTRTTVSQGHTVNSYRRDNATAKTDPTSVSIRSSTGTGHGHGVNASIRIGPTRHSSTISNNSSFHG